MGKYRFKSKTYVLGDLHGYSHALQEVLRKANFNKKLDKLIFIGDLADGMTDFIKALKIFSSITNFIPIMGNHDIMLKEWLETSKISQRWKIQGGLKTIEEIESCSYDIKPLLYEYFKKVKYYHIESDKLFCHGGFDNKKPIDTQKKLNFCINRKLYKLAKTYDKNNLKIKPIFTDNIKINEIFIGHTPTKKYYPEFLSNLINVDTGAGKGGKLTLMDIYSKQYVQSRKTNIFYN